MAKYVKQDQIDCRKCKYSDKRKIGDHMILCKKLNVYRSFGLRYCKLSES